MTRTRRVAAVTASLVAVATLVWIGARTDRIDPVVGSWLVHAPNAPFPHHMFTFHADHTMSQANPDAGNQTSSDSNGAGTWTRYGHHITGLFVEVTADRHTGAPIGTGRISFTLAITGDTLTGTAEAHFHDPTGRHLRGPLPTALHGTRVRQ